MSHHYHHPKTSMLLSEMDLIPITDTLVKKGSHTKILPALGIDFGTKFVGIALASTPIAQPLTIAANNDELLNYICTLIEDYQVKTVVIGLSENRTARLTRQFVARLATTITARIEYTDETLSTQVVRAKLQAGGRHLKPNERIDHYAAADFLQEWLESHKGMQ